MASWPPERGRLVGLAAACRGAGGRSSLRARAGIEVLEFNRTMPHQKTTVVDERWGTVGTTNADSRSPDLPERRRRLRSHHAQDLEATRTPPADEGNGRVGSGRTGLGCNGHVTPRVNVRPGRARNCRRPPGGRTKRLTSPSRAVLPGAPEGEYRSLFGRQMSTARRSMAGACRSGRTAGIVPVGTVA
jgi:hypothetical protein